MECKQDFSVLEDGGSEKKEAQQHINFLKETMMEDKLWIGLSILRADTLKARQTDCTCPFLVRSTVLSEITFSLHLILNSNTM